MNNEQLYNAAHVAGQEAVKNVIVKPMAVVDNKQIYFVEDGLCGFA